MLSYGMKLIENVHQKSQIITFYNLKCLNCDRSVPKYFYMQMYDIISQSKPSFHTDVVNTERMYI